VNDKVNDKVNDRVNDSEIVVLNLLYEDPAYTYAEIAKRADISRKTVAARMKSLQEKGIVERIGTNKKGYWKINE
ncbi:MAG: winged helix-turn-helix domain-containing protein, partial [Lachnoclostridium sp.]|nr:winged helix-turn-helix domain-containing protein [Lachnoclostridium sp.]